MNANAANASADDGDIPTPRENLELIGHDAAERTVLDAWNANRMPHAWLITGPRGIGKATFAYRVARFVLAQAGAGQGADEGPGLFGDDLPPAVPDTLALDPGHPVVDRVASGGHADLRVLSQSAVETGGPSLSGTDDQEGGSHGHVSVSVCADSSRSGSLVTAHRHPPAA